ncbi:GDP-fucose protein O-fucosyltransferase [Carex littledalei]|uniref:O-fucosyltransferase family protein n=1 Tax=Carex littledalei TaxID=544730 RepID=A0A833VQN2_9POAL|nr:GDP-fucose protein O-fucosyltransferase [Carex littledalei]
MAKHKTKHLSYITVPSKIIPLHHSLLSKSQKSSPVQALQFPTKPKFLVLLLFLILFLTFHLGFRLPFSPVPINGNGSSQHSTHQWQRVDVAHNVSNEFWRQPNDMAYRPCLEFSEEYRKETAVMAANKRKYLLVVVSGGLNQQKIEIVDAVVIARILGAALVVPILQVNAIWGDESEFSDIFDLEQFKKVLGDDVQVVSSLPSTHIMARIVTDKQIPLLVSPQQIRSRYLKRFNREGVLLLRGLNTKLSKDLPTDLQKLRCKVAFQALRFSAPIMTLGNKLAVRMRSRGPYLALHLRLEKDVWIRTGCLPSLSPESDKIIQEQRKLHPELLTGRSNMSSHERKLAGQCPLTAQEVARLLKALGAPSDTRIFWAGGKPYGGPTALQPLTRKFPNFYNKEDLALPGELAPFANKSSILAAIDYIVCEQSDVFMPSHGGNMGHLMQGDRAFAGHKKFITPNKRQMIPYFLNPTLAKSEFNRIVKALHQSSSGQPEIRTDRAGRDVTAYPVPECMCNGTDTRSTV